jgi:hypothetical protein
MSNENVEKTLTPEQHRSKVMDLLYKGFTSINNFTEPDLAEIVKYTGAPAEKLCTLFGLPEPTWIALVNVIRERKAAGASTGA